MMMMIYRNVNRTATMWFSSNRVAFNRNCPHNRDNIAAGMQKALPVLLATFCQPTHTVFISVACGMYMNWQEYLALWGIHFSNFGVGSNLLGGEEKDLIYLILENLVTNFCSLAAGTEGIRRNGGQNTASPDPGLKQAPRNTNPNHCRDTRCCMWGRIK